MTALRNELHELVDQLPETKVAPALRLIRGQLEDEQPERDLPFIGTLEAEPDFAERAEEILRSEQNHPL